MKKVATRNQPSAVQSLYRSAGVSPAIAEQVSGCVVTGLWTVPAVCQSVPVAMFRSKRRDVSMSHRRRTISICSIRGRDAVLRAPGMERANRLPADETNSYRFAASPARIGIGRSVFSAKHRVVDVRPELL